MTCLPELHYFFDTEGFPFEKALRVIARTIGVQRTHFEALVISPIKGTGETEKKVM